jgi:hypothetical protein
MGSSRKITIEVPENMSQRVTLDFQVFESKEEMNAKHDRQSCSCRKEVNP